MAQASRRNRRPRVCPECADPTPPPAPLAVVGISGSNGDNFLVIEVDSGILGVVPFVEFPENPAVINDGNAVIVNNVRKDSVTTLVVDLNDNLVPGDLSIEIPPATYGIVSSIGSFIVPGIYSTTV